MDQPNIAALLLEVDARRICVIKPSALGDVIQALRDMGHEVAPVGNVAGGMGAIQFHDDGGMTGAACWRADGTPIGMGGGYARKGVRFRPEARR